MMNKMRARRCASSALVAVSIFGLAACGAGKPSEDELAKKLTSVFEEMGMPKAQATEVAECASPKFIKDISSDALNKIVDKDFEDLKEAEVKKEDEEAMTKITQGCAEEVISGS